MKFFNELDHTVFDYLKPVLSSVTTQASVVIPL